MTTYERVDVFLFFRVPPRLPKCVYNEKPAASWPNNKHFTSRTRFDVRPSTTWKNDEENLIIYGCRLPFAIAQTDNETVGGGLSLLIPGWCDVSEFHEISM